MIFMTKLGGIIGQIIRIGVQRTIAAGMELLVKMESESELLPLSVEDTKEFSADPHGDVCCTPVACCLKRSR